ncbi:6966_t:CDS:1, partial [Paraglomus occultum]
GHCGGTSAKHICYTQHHFINKAQKSARSPGNCPRLIDQWGTPTQKSKHNRNIPTEQIKPLWSQGTAPARSISAIHPATRHQSGAPDTGAPCI